ncbi:MAG: hypothetical protein AMS27_09920 [Bacteroides sp. SM23_62_1]|nr:MAG: hypothetical protein AMS27_09920 [Bacteroides sp. SM23_62_1]
MSGKGVILVHDTANRKVNVYIDGDIFTAYIYPENLEKPILFPVRTSRGTFVTRGFPLDPRAGERVDHPHQVGVWLNYGDVNGFDFWNNSYAVPADQEMKYGKITHKTVKQATSIDDTGILAVSLEWIVHYQELLPYYPIINEETRYEFSGDENTRVIDRITALTANIETVLFTDNKEGLFAIRVDRAFEYPSDEPLKFTDASGIESDVEVLDNEGVNGHYRNSKGIEGLDVWGQRAEWVSLSATKDGEDITIAIFDHPSNPGFPAYWHARGYGLFAVNNLGQKIFSDGKEELNFALKQGESVTFKYRIYITSGYKATDDELNEQFSRFSEK